MKTWAPYDRLIAADLNTGFAWANDQTIPGAFSTALGAEESGAANEYDELKHAQPPAGGDPLGIWQSSGRLIIPAGMGGLWQYLQVVGSYGGTATNATTTYMTVDGVRYLIGSISRHATSSMPMTAGLVMFLNPGQVIYGEVRYITTGGSALMRAWSLIRLGRGLGVPGGTPALAAGALPGPGGGEELEEEGVPA